MQRADGKLISYRKKLDSVLSDTEIRHLIDDGLLQIYPFDAQMLQPASLDVRLDRYFRAFQNHRYEYIDPSQHQQGLTREIEVPAGEPFILHPGEFALASTWETVGLSDDIAARVEGKSSLGRLGLLTHSTAGFVDPGFYGQLTLELANVATLPIRLWPGMKIGQLCFFRLAETAEQAYGSKQLGSRYQGQIGPQQSLGWQNFHIMDIYGEQK